MLRKIYVLLAIVALTVAFVAVSVQALGACAPGSNLNPC